MKRFPVLVILSLIFILNFSAKSQIIRGNGNLKTDLRALSGFNEIIAQGSFSVILTQGEKEGIRIETDENIVEIFQTRIEKQTLYITMLADVRKSEKLNVYVSIKELTKIVLLNDISLKTETVIHFDDLKIFSGGMSKLNIELFAASLSVELNDGTYGYLKGYSENFNAQIHDETEMNAFDLQTDFCEVLSTGLTEVMVDVQKELKFLVSGASNLYYTGSPTITERIFSSSGFIVKRQRKSN